MSIYAQRTSFRSSAQFPDFKVTRQLLPGQILVYDEKLRAFVNKPSSSITGSSGGGGGGGGGGLTSATNIGSGAEVFESINVDELQFRTLVAGNGIDITEGAEEITISSDIVDDSCIRAPDDFKIVIDSDNDTECDAKFEIYTNKYVAQTILTPVTYSAGPSDVEVVSDPGGTDPGQFVVDGVDFAMLGFEAGMCLRVTGTDEQDGVWEIASIDSTNSTNDTLTITIHFTDDTDNGIQPAGVTFEAVYFKILTPMSFTSVGAAFDTQGFTAGQTIEISGTPSGATGTAFAEYVTGETIIIDGTTVTLSTGGLAIQSGDAGATYTNGETIVINSVTVTLSTGTTVTDAVTDITAAAIPGLTAAEVSGTLVLSTTTSALVLAEGSGTALADLGFTAGTFPLMSGVADAVTDITTAAIPGITATVVDDALRLISSNQSITLAEGSGSALADLGLTAGTFTDGGINDGTYTIDSVVGDTVTILETFTGTFPACVVGNISITVVPSEDLPTGWWVNECGEMQAKDTTIMGDLDVTGDTTVEGDLFLGSTNILDLISAASGITTTDGILVQTTPGTIESREIDVGTGLSITNQDGISGDPLIELDAELQTIAGGLANPGYVVWDGSDYVDRELEGTVNQITLTDPDGVAGNTVIGLADNAVLPGSASVTIPKGSTAQQPGSPVEGMIRYNTDDDVFEGYVDGSWEPFSNEGAFLPLTGGTMTGNIALVGADIVMTGLETVDGRDVSEDGAVLDAINTGTGIKVQIAPDTFVNVEIDVEANTPLTILNGDGVSGDPTIGFDINMMSEQNTAVDPKNDYLVMYDDSSGEHKKVNPDTVTRRPALRYFYAQI